MAGTQIVINVAGGLVQNVFCSDLAAEAIVVDWDTEGAPPDEPGIVPVRDVLGRERLAQVTRRDVALLSELAGTEAEAAIEAAALEPVVRWRTAA
jgi:hypothetical protein